METYYCRRCFKNNLTNDGICESCRNLPEILDIKCPRCCRNNVSMLQSLGDIKVCSFCYIDLKYSTIKICDRDIKNCVSKMNQNIFSSLVNLILS